MIDEIFVIDDIISKKEQEKFLNIIENTNLNWLKAKNITGKYGKQEGKEFPGKILLDIPNEIFNEFVEKIQNNIFKKINVDCIKVIRNKINWTTPIHTEYESIHLLHIDNSSEHLVIIYYINDSTGDTFIFQNENGDNSQEIYKHFNNEIDYNKFQILKNISPKMGRVVVFNGLLHHYGDYPKEGNRFVLNSNVAIKKTNKSLI